MAESDWKGNLNDDCTLERYGMLAHVEELDRNVWWFAVSAAGGNGDMLYNMADAKAQVRLTTAKMARAAAECVLEVLRLSRLAEGGKNSDVS